MLAVDTPALGIATVTDPMIDSLSVSNNRGKHYLQTSPEYYMKRLLAADYPDIYSIGRVFRHGEVGRRHLPEFTMIEWYRHNFVLSDIISDTLRFIGEILNTDAKVCADIHDYANVFEVFAGVDPARSDLEELAAVAGADDALVASLGGRRDALLDLLLTRKIAPKFAADQPTVVRHYPQSQAALARRCPDDSSVADRFEVFWGSLELANGYVELSDAGEQASRMRNDIVTRKSLSKPAVPVDTNLLAALESGLPACAGVAVGFERLHMIVAQTEDIRDVVTFA